MLFSIRELKRRQKEREKLAKKAEKEATAPPATSSSAPKQAADIGEEHLDPSVSHCKQSPALISYHCYFFLSSFLT